MRNHTFICGLKLAAMNLKLTPKSWCWIVQVNDWTLEVWRIYRFDFVLSTYFYIYHGNLRGRGSKRKIIFQAVGMFQFQSRTAASFGYFPRYICHDFQAEFAIFFGKKKWHRNREHIYCYRGHEIFPTYKQCTITREIPQNYHDPKNAWNLMMRSCAYFIESASWWLWPFSHTRFADLQIWMLCFNTSLVLYPGGLWLCGVDFKEF